MVNSELMEINVRNGVLTEGFDNTGAGVLELHPGTYGLILS